eukprot:jgi/Mesvir1/7532/Mv19280-RA.1
MAFIFLDAAPTARMATGRRHMRASVTARAPLLVVAATVFLLALAAAPHVGASSSRVTRLPRRSLSSSPQGLPPRLLPAVLEEGEKGVFPLVEMLRRSWSLPTAVERLRRSLLSAPEDAQVEETQGDPGADNVADGSNADTGDTGNAAGDPQPVDDETGGGGLGGQGEEEDGASAASAVSGNGEDATAGDGGQDNDDDRVASELGTASAAKALAELLVREGVPQDGGADVGGGFAQPSEEAGVGEPQPEDAAPGEVAINSGDSANSGVTDGQEGGDGQGDAQGAGGEDATAGGASEGLPEEALPDGSAGGGGDVGADVTPGGNDGATPAGMDPLDDAQWPTEEAVRQHKPGLPISDPDLADTPAPVRERYKTVGARIEPPVLIRFDREPAEELQCVPVDSKVAPVVERLPYHEQLACFDMTPAMAALLHMRPDRNADDNVLCVKRAAIADAVASGADTIWKTKGFSADPHAKLTPGDQSKVYDLAEFIGRDMATWHSFGVTPTALEQGLLSIPGLLLVKIVSGKLYMHAGVQVDCHRGAFLFRGLLEMLAAFADNVPDLLFLVTLSTRPVVPRDKFREGVPPPVFSPAGSAMHFDIPFPMWNFWGDLPPAGAHTPVPGENVTAPPEVSPTLTPHVDPPWDVLMPLLRDMSHSIHWEKKTPQALWRAPAYSSPPELPPVPMPAEPTRKKTLIKHGKKIYPPEVFGLHHEVDAMLACVNGRFPELSIGVVDTYDSMHHVERDMIKKVQHGLKPLTPTERCRYRYLLYLERPDGLDPVTLLQSLGCESVLMMPLPEYFTFFSRALQPGKHFVQLPYSRHSLCAAVRRQVAVFNNNPANAMQLASNLRSWVMEHLNMGNVYRYMVLALQKYAQLQRFRVVLTEDDIELTPENLPEFVAPCQG